MNQLWLFLLLAWLLRSPLLALLVLAALWWLGDRATFRLVPDPFRWLTRWRRRGELKALLEVNPHDRRARFELAELLLEAGHPAAAVEALRPNVAAGDEDVHTAFLWGAALGRSGAFGDGEKALLVARQLEAEFRAGEIDLELGRQRLARGDATGAAEALERLLVVRPGTVEGRYHLARALDRLGRAAEAAACRDDAWREFRALPRFQRAQQRGFVWRMRPVQGVLAVGAVAAGLVLVLAILRQLVLGGGAG